MSMANTMSTTITVDPGMFAERVIAIDVEYEINLGVMGNRSEAPEPASVEILSVKDDYDDDITGGLSEKDLQGLRFEAVQEVLREANEQAMEYAAVKGINNVVARLELLRASIERKLLWVNTPKATR